MKRNNTMKKMLLILAVATSATLPALAATPYNGQTTPGDYTISTFAQLRLFEETLHGVDFDFDGATITLAADIDCDGESFAPEDGLMAFFLGTFDGAGHRIHNFTNVCHQSASLLGAASHGAVVKNVTLEGYIRTTTDGLENWGAAPFAEWVRGPYDGSVGLTMENCHFIGTVVNNQTGSDGFVAAGLVGYVTTESRDGDEPESVNIVITNCTVNATIEGRESAGGLVATGYGIRAVDCAVTGEVRRAQNVGGLGGYIRENSVFTRCSFDGTVRTTDTLSNSPGSGGGGLVGVAENARFEGCTARGLVKWEYFVANNNFVDRSYYMRTDASYNFTGCGGAVGLTFGESAFRDCSFEGTVASTNGFYGGFVGWTAGAEVFSNCTARAIYAPLGTRFTYGTGGFAGTVASDGALFIDCSAAPLEGSKRILGGFFGGQTPCIAVNISPNGVGSNAFVRCSASGFDRVDNGFAAQAWNCTFRECSVRDVIAKEAGFIGSAGLVPGDGYAYAQNSLYEDCSVADSRVRYGFATSANYNNKNACTNVFRRCRAGCAFGDSSMSGYSVAGFAGSLYKGSVVEDCAAYGPVVAGRVDGGFAARIREGASVRRCVAAVRPTSNDDRGAGFAGTITYGATVEDCYSLYAPTAADTYYNQYGTQGGFVQYASNGYNDLGPAIARCFALAAPPDGSDSGSSGSFCGYAYNPSYANFVDCYRPAESNVRDVGNGDNDGDDAGVGALTKAQFAVATAATMPNYDFGGVWRAPGGVASSPYLAASTDAQGRFWFSAAVLSGSGSILVNGAAPAESYAPGTVLTVEAVPEGGNPFTGWVGEGFADPTAQRTTYTVRNVSAIGATFGTPIYTVEDFTNLLSSASSPSGNYALMNDLDFTGVVESMEYATSVSVSSFQGKFFGGGHTIRGLCPTNGTFTTTFALFQNVSAGAEIRDLTVVSSNVPNDQNTLSMAGLAASVGSGVTISNCHAVVDWQGVYPAVYENYAYNSCMYYGLVRTVSGSDIRIVDCSVEGRLAGGTEACGFVGSASLNGGEIARCAVLAEVCAITNRTGGKACGFAQSISLNGGATLRECFSAGIVDAAANAYGFADQISFGDTASSMRDCYSVSEVKAGGSNYYYSYGIASSFSGYDSSSPNLVTNVWFGGTVRGGYRNYAISGDSNYSVTLANCKESATRSIADWAGYDFANVWTMTDGATTPYFAWSLVADTKVGPPTGGTGFVPSAFRLFAVQEEGKTITHPATAAAGSTNAVSATATDGSFFCGWTGAASYTNAAANPSAVLADNHRTVRAIWGKAVNTRADLAAIADDPTGTYGLGADIDLAGENWTPLCRDSYTPFSGTLYGLGHTISNMTVDTEGGECAGLFGRLQDGATVTDLTLVNPVVRGANCTGTLAGYVEGATISGCSVEGADVTASSERAGCFVGQIEGASSVSRCTASGSITGSGRYVGGFVGSVAGSASVTQCSALGSVAGSGESTGGFVGYVEGSPSFSECFACGTVSSTADNTGGFAGYLYGTPSVTDCYALADVKGGRYVGGFVGQIYYYNGAVSRCYAAGSALGSSEVGSFVGRQYRGSPSFADCFRPADGLPDLGTDTTDLAGIDSLNAAGFLARSNFASYHATGKWSQLDGATQPYFAWGLVDGKMTLSGAIAGTGSGSISGLGAYAPGTVVQISAVPAGSVFLGWTGNAPYADASAQTTTIPLDNFRIVTAEFGALIQNRAQLDAMRAAPGGSYALGADIDLSDEAWAPVGDNSTPFTGSLYARGHKITGLRYDNSSGSYAGLFGAVSGATLDGIHLEGVSVNGRQYTGGLVGEVRGATVIRNCSAEGVVSNSYGYAGLLVGRVYGAGTVFENCAATGAVVAATQDTGGLVGGVYYYPATFADCDAAVDVSGTSGNNKGGFVGSVRDSNASATFARCSASGEIVATNNSSNVGGFIGYANKPVSFEDCSAAGDVSGKGSTGGFAGKTESAVATYVRCSASGTVVSLSSSYAGGFIGSVSGQNSRFEDCAARGPLVNSTSSQTGGFAGNTGGSGIVFADCVASNDVRSTSSQTGGFAGYVSSSNDFVNCSAAGSVSGTSQTGGFVGQANGDRSQYLSCVANGSVAASGDDAGGFVGRIGSTGLRFAQCSALGGVSDSAYSYIGGFVGQVNNSNDLWRCMSAGAATGKQYVGGFVGYQYGGNTTIRECFALGDATATYAGDAYAGGFAGDLYAATYISDSYCLGTVKGQQKAGGFAGRNYNSGTTITRCYAAGVVDCSGTYAGAFIGYNQYVPTFTDCAAACAARPPYHAIGSSTAGSSDENAAIAEFSSAEFHSTANFATWLSVQCGDGNVAVWSQTDGVTQPYLAWSAPTGQLSVYSSVGGSAHGTVEGAGQYAPGATATVTATSSDGFFLSWTGSTPYADPTTNTTTFALDNHRVAAVLFGRLIRTADELDAVRNDLAGIYGLANDIDLAGRDWTPIGFNNAKFTGTFYGFGHEVKNMVCTNNPGTQRHGLFGWTSGATLDGIRVSGVVRSTSACTGGLVGTADATVIRDCHADVDVTTTYRYAGALVGGIGGTGTTITGCSAKGSVTSTDSYAGGLAGGSDNGSFEISDSVSSAEVTSTGGTVGGFIGYLATSCVISGCRADGYASGNGNVGGFVGYISSAVTVSNCVARGDVRSSYSNYGGFVGRLYNSSARIENCWCSGAVWGTGGTIGAFVGQKSSGTISGCSIYAYGAGPRPFCGNDGNLSGGSLNATQIENLSKDANGDPWPAVKLHVDGATPISTAEELLAVTNDLSGIYVLTKDIDLGGATISPIGNESGGFKGEFYGKNHKIKNFVVNTTERYAGLFGLLDGARVNGVVAEGIVTGGWTGSGSLTGTGGFAGRIDTYSLVDGCSFEGAVTNTTTYYTGGFVGRTDASPVILRSCCSASVVNLAQYYAGGFVGYHNGGYIMDCYAIADVEAGSQRYVGGFAGSVTSGRITTSWCAGSVSATGSYKGDFAGYASGSDYITKSYYDATKASGLGAVNSSAHAGVTGLATTDMMQQETYRDGDGYVLDFNRTWLIDDGETYPYLQTFLVVKTGFDAWAERSGLPEGTEPDDDVNGIPAGIRYVFDIPSDVTSLNALSTPFFNVASGSNGRMGVKFRAMRDGYEGVTVVTEVFATTDLTDWTHLVPMAYDIVSDTWYPADGIQRPRMFFRWRLTLERTE